jgi:hypothetical protein
MGRYRVKTRDDVVSLTLGIEGGEPEAWRQNSVQLRNAASITTKLQPHTAQQPLIRISSKLVRDLPRRRRARGGAPCSNPPSPQPASVFQTVLDTPRRSKLLAEARAYAGKMPRKELFKIYNVTERTGYKIINEGNVCRGLGVHNRGRKQILADHQCAAIEAVEDANFYFAFFSHYKVAEDIGLVDCSEQYVLM